ncbi:tRNA (adenosine(37)-N6)-threonylcarbamoyltransferase complex dimerization subunit type 1 TsaB [Hyphobacterium sp. HN65]|uniref:tRNA (Adenosine(37)-N6)-threonylcarbamoyltransferase complex dimerization subunit type 1 TsaB n=1 Tax=Hyphobacterium lacteum TaxID=3116575 RepID=A0ABU7LRZ3_9PROT|nr:tRNA (adenosine(37)-N6)-threonylcarbamoyltransferase complex dimerization subunit type 1 TsaB [Hyphobacterium sp. HN65]MEE2526686.1 tRNA (adenosine(37)-N6)-threonylcarbamoyltransferase complex dimerization subunit type 1 TsaB [Hyphobacterium sp. HN65]
MRILAIDTTGPACSVALRLPGPADHVSSETMARGQAERLAPMVRDLLAEVGLAPSGIDRIGAAVGPGSFAGSRIGVAFARGLALATGAECIGISNLQWWASSAEMPEAGSVLVVHDARRGEVVLQGFDPNGPLAAAETRPMEDARAALAASPGNGAHRVLTGTGAHLLDGGPERQPPRLAALLDLIEAAKPPFHPPKPFYARPPDAKLPGGREA